jgi:hypothetical protein
MDKIVELDVYGQIFTHPDGDYLHQWKMIEYGLVADCDRILLLPLYGHTSSGHFFRPLFPISFVSGFLGRQP